MNLKELLEKTKELLKEEKEFLSEEEYKKVFEEEFKIIKEEEQNKIDSKPICIKISNSNWNYIIDEYMIKNIEIENEYDDIMNFDGMNRKFITGSKLKIFLIFQTRDERDNFINLINYDNNAKISFFVGDEEFNFITNLYINNYLISDYSIEIEGQIM